MNRTIIPIILLLRGLSLLHGEIVKPADAPLPKPPAESGQLAQLPDGFQLELIAAEPLVRQPTGLCFAADGSLFVTEGHGYNMEGQYDIEELNKTGKLDRLVRRIPAPEEAIRRAEQDQIGTVKRLTDTDGDGIMDRAETWADSLPMCMGLTPASGGVIVVCAPEILFLADRDGDGFAEVRERLFSGFNPSIVERRINSPILGPDNWIYVDGGKGGRITGPKLPAPVDIPVTGFRFKPDGTAIEPVSGHSSTYGFTFNAAGDRFVVSTGTPGIQVAPLPWRYLVRNENLAISPPRRNAADYERTFPISQPHPWRTKRAADQGFNKYYSSRYGAAEAVPDGYFTSACSPLVYLDTALPGLHGNLFTCEPSQNMVHRSTILRQGVHLNLLRTIGEENGEFLASKDVWFHPIHLQIGPDGGIWIADFYREIIEDYSAIPRYLQQQYGLKDGENHGRIWRITHTTMPAKQRTNMPTLTLRELARELASPRHWRRQTARRLLLEQAEPLNSQIVESVSQLAQHPESVIALNALYTLEGLGHLNGTILEAALQHDRPGVRRHALRLADARFDTDPKLLQIALKMVSDPSAIVRLQLALSLGELPTATALAALEHLAREHGNDAWMSDAILSSLAHRGGALLGALLTSPTHLGQAAKLVPRIFQAVGNRRDAAELSQSIAMLSQLTSPALQSECLKRLQSAFPSRPPIALTAPASASLIRLTQSENASVRAPAIHLTRLFSIESPAERSARFKKTLKEIKQIDLPLDLRLAAVRSLADENEVALIKPLLDTYASSTPDIRRAILSAAFQKTAYLPVVVTALEQNRLPPSALSAVQRSALTEQEGEPGARAKAVLSSVQGLDSELASEYLKALKGPRDSSQGEQVFREHCASCHEAHGIGFSVGPNLTSESGRSEETIVRDVLAPSDTITAGHETYLLETNDGRLLSGILAFETATSLTLTLPGGDRIDTLRHDIKSLKTLPVSLMPESLATVLKPAALANLTAWLRQLPDHLSLFDESRTFDKVLNEGQGTAKLDFNEVSSGTVSLHITPPQRFARKIPGWRFPITENPGPGQFRYLRLAWKAPNATGIMIELAHDGHWPSSKNPHLRYFSGANTTGWEATQVSETVPKDWKSETIDLWKGSGDFILTGIAPTTMGGDAWFDRIELWRMPPTD